VYAGLQTDQVRRHRADQHARPVGRHRWSGASRTSPEAPRRRYTSSPGRHWSAR
jgi:hypothetical protein